MAVKFDSTGDLLYLTSGTPNRVSRTMLCWVRVDTDNGVNSPILMRYADAGGTIKQGLYVDSSGANAILGVVGQTSGGTLTLLSPFTIGTWVPLAIVTRQGASVLENDGYYGASASAITLIGNVSSGDTADTSPALAIGGTGADNSGISVAFARVWNAELTLAEIKAEFGSATPVKTSNLYADYRFVNGSLTTDSSGNGHTLTTNATPAFTADPSFSVTAAPGVGAVTLTGLAPTVSVSGGTTISPGVGAVTITGQTPVALRGAVAQPGAGTVTVTGQTPVALRGTVVQPGAGAVTLTGLAPALLTGVVVQPGVGAVTFSGATPSVLQNVIVAPGAGAVAFTGAAPALLVGTTAQPGVGAVTIAGAAPTLLLDTVVQPGVGSITVSGQAPNIGAGAFAQPGAAAVTLTGQAPTTAQGFVVQPGAGTVTFTGVAPSLASVLPVPAGTVVLTGLTPSVSVSNNAVATPGVGAIAVSGQQPAAVSGGSVISQPSAGVVTVTGQAPTVTTTDNVVATPGAGTVLLAGLQPTVLRDAYAQPGSGAAVVSGQAPTIQVSDNQTVQPGTGTVTITGLAPSLSGAVTAAPDAGQVTLQGYEPTVLNTTPNSDLANDPKYMGGRNIKFKPLKKDVPAPEPMLPAQITNMPDAPPPPYRKYGLMQALADLPGEYDGPRLIPPAPAVAKVTPAPAPKPAKSAIAPAVESAPQPVPAPQVNLEELIGVVGTLMDGREKALQEQLDTMAAQLERTTQQLREVEAELQVDKMLARIHARRAENQRRAEEITAKLLEG